jgi:predicted phage-related endonuclease
MIEYIEQIKIESEEQWLDLRKRDVTASVAPALLGIHEFLTPYKLYNQKAGLTDSNEETTPMLWGRALEPVAADIIRRQRPDWEIIYPVGLYYRDVKARLGCTPDIQIIDERGRRGNVQVKAISPWASKKWWNGETIEPPLWIAVQAIIEAKLTRAEVCYVAAFSPFSQDFQIPLIEVPLHDELFEKIKAEVAEFWLRMEEGRPYPPDYKKDAAEIAKRYPVGMGTEIDLSGDNGLCSVADRLLEARAAKAEAAAIEGEAKAEISHKIGDASSALLADGRRISFKSQTSKGKECPFAAGNVCREPIITRPMKISKGPLT